MQKQKKQSVFKKTANTIEDNIKKPLKDLTDML